MPVIWGGSQLPMGFAEIPIEAGSKVLCNLAENFHSTFIDSSRIGKVTRIPNMPNFGLQHCLGVDQSLTPFKLQYRYPQVGAISTPA